MKKLRFFSLAVVAMLCAGFVSCSDDKEEEPQIPTEDAGGDTDTNEDNPAFVDLGLSVKWATCNLGADAPEVIGDYYAWGETATKNEYTDATYFDSEYSIYTISGKRNIYGSSRDAAYVNLGENWRMPTTEEIGELINSCTWQEEELNGVRGMRGTASNGNSIFLPITGMFAGNSIQSTSQGCYWGGELYQDSRFASMLTFFRGGEVSLSRYYRYEGMAIRPVYIGVEEDNGSQEPPTSDDTPEDNLPATSKNFVGYWVNNNFESKSEYRPNLYFSADEICLVMSKSQDGKWSYDYTWYTHVNSGYWAYDASSKILATTVGSWQFSVTLSNEQAWSGVFRTGDDTFNESWHKASNLDVADILLGWIKWKQADGTEVSLSEYVISEDENDDDYVFNYAKGTEKGTVTIKNPFYLSESSVIFTGSRNETLYW